ncbi:MGDG synthase family glycosyltransferase [Paenibacillus sp. sptzw28]|uniref:MGDG synthase family glycosyltransferase n=1 Tax=Paenibacillus sp. sptzw28 TaxID=715179 RepID=UPI0021612688|nr:hypothetical protein [Paenibacillus sp. sptzw28]
MQQGPKIIILTAGYGTGHIQVSKTLQESFHRYGVDRVKIMLGKKKMIDIMKEEKPDAIVYTFPFAGVSEQLKSQGITVPLFTVITDFSLHNRWLLTNSDRFYVATDDLKRDMVSRGIQPARIAVTGIPIRERFYERRALQGQRENKRSILIITGAHGVLPISK